MTRIAVAVNPTADRGRADSAGVRALARLHERGVDVVEVSGVTYADALERARAAVSEGVDSLVVVGGDGMVHLGVNAVAGTTTPLGIVAAGSGNDFARAVGLPVRDPASAVAVLLDCLGAGPRAVDAARASTPGKDQDVRWFCGVLSAGLDAAVNARANALRRPRGRAKYAVAVLDELRRFEPFGYRVTTDGTSWESRGTLVAVANGPSIGGGIRIAPGAELDDGLLDVVLAGPLTRLGAARIFPRTYSGGHAEHPAVSVVRGRTVVIEATGAGATPPPAFADGELVGALPLEVTVVPGALHVLAPHETRSSASGPRADVPT